MKRLFVCIAAAGFLFSCSKGNDTPATPSKKDVLMSKKWQISGLTLTIPILGPIDAYSTYLPDYEKDDYIQFKSDMTYELNANTNKEPGNTNSILDAGTWDLTNNDATLQLHSNSDSTLLPSNTQVKELTDTKLSLEGTYSNPISVPGSPIPITGATALITFKPL